MARKTAPKPRRSEQSARRPEPIPPRAEWDHARGRGSKESDDAAAPQPLTSAPAFAVAAAMVTSWMFGVIVRLAEVPRALAKPGYAIDGHMSFTATDAFTWAASVLSGIGQIQEPLTRMPPWSDQAHTTIATLLARVFPAEQVFVVMPAVVAPLVVVPLVLLGVIVQRPLWGFAAALVHAVGFSYYRRTRAAYFDTDMFSVTVPVLVVTLLVGAVTRRSAQWGWAAALVIAAGPYFYSSIGSVLLAVTGMFVVYVLAFHRRDAFAWTAIGLVMAANLPLAPGPRTLVVALLGGVVFVLEHMLARAPAGVASDAPPAVPAWRARLEAIPRRHLIAGASVLLGALLLVVLSSKAEAAWLTARAYLVRETAAPALPGDIAFVPVFSTVREAAQVPFAELAMRFAGNTPLLVLALGGFVAACVQHRAMLLWLPLLGLGVFANWGGMRFSIFAVPVVSLGLGWLAHSLAWSLARRAPRFRTAAGFLTTALVCTPVLALEARNAGEVTSEPKVLPEEVALMRFLGDVAQPGDYALSWWDYGYPLRYYARVNTLLDGARSGDDAFVASQVLFSTDQRQAANLARAAIERYHGEPGAFAITSLFDDAKATGSTPRAFLEQLASPAFQPPAKTREIYLYIPYRMLNISKAVASFSAAARAPEGSRERHLTLVQSPVAVRKNTLSFTRTGHRYAMDTRTLTDAQGRNIDVQALHVARVGDSGRYGAVSEHFASADDMKPTDQDGAEGGIVGETASEAPRRSGATSGVHVIFLPDSGQGMIADDATFRSTLIQLLVLGRGEPDAFREMVRAPAGVVVRVER